MLNLSKELYFLSELSQEESEDVLFKQVWWDLFCKFFLYLSSNKIIIIIVAQ